MPNAQWSLATSERLPGAPMSQLRQARRRGEQALGDPYGEVEGGPAAARLEPQLPLEGIDDGAQVRPALAQRAVALTFVAPSSRTTASNPRLAYPIGHDEQARSSGDLSSRLGHLPAVLGRDRDEQVPQVHDRLPAGSPSGKPVGEVLGEGDERLAPALQVVERGHHLPSKGCPSCRSGRPSASTVAVLGGWLRGQPGSAR